MARSVIVAKFFALVHGFHYSYTIRDLGEEITEFTMSIEVLIDINTVLYVIANNSKTTEKILQFDVFALRDSHENGELNNQGWVPGDRNNADPLTK